MTLEMKDLQTTISSAYKFHLKAKTNKSEDYFLL